MRQIHQIIITLGIYVGQYIHITCTRTRHVPTFSSDLRSDLWVGFRLSTVDYNMYTARRAIEFLCEYRTVYLKLCLNFFSREIFFLHKQRAPPLDPVVAAGAK